MSLGFAPHHPTSNTITFGDNADEDCIEVFRVIDEDEIGASSSGRLIVQMDLFLSSISIADRRSAGTFRARVPVLMRKNNAMVCNILSTNDDESGRLACCARNTVWIFYNRFLESSNLLKL